MLNSKTIKQSGFGGLVQLPCVTYRPEKSKQIAEIIQEHKGKVIAKGMGRFYGGQFIQPEGVIDTHRLDRFLDFNEAEGIIKVESGITLKDIQTIIFKKGWSLPFFVADEKNTIGGIIAGDIKAANIAIEDYIISFSLYNHLGELIDCSREEKIDLFFATIGGCGLTGVICTVSLQLVPAKTQNYKIERTTIDSVDKIQDVLLNNSSNEEVVKDKVKIKKSATTSKSKKKDKGEEDIATNELQGDKLRFICTKLNGGEIKSYAEEIEFSEEKTEKKKVPRSLALHRLVPRFFKFQIEENKFDYRYNVLSEIRADEDYLLERRVRSVGNKAIKFSCVIELSFIEDFINYLNSKIKEDHPQTVIVRMFYYKQRKNYLSADFEGCYLYFEIKYDDSNKELIQKIQDFIIDKKGVNSFIDFHENTLFDKSSFSKHVEDAIAQFNEVLTNHHYTERFSSIFSERLELLNDLVIEENIEEQTETEDDDG